MWHGANMEICGYEHLGLSVMHLSCENLRELRRGNLSEALQRPLPFQKHEI